MSLSPAESYRWTAAVLVSLRGALEEHGFEEILPAILSERFEPGARHAVAVLGERALPEIERHSQNGAGVSVRGRRLFYLPVSHCVEKQLALEHAERVYCLAPCVRLLMDGEDETGRHLFTFFQVEIEWRTERVDDVLSTVENLLACFAERLTARLDRHGGLDEAGRKRIGVLSTAPYERIPFAEAKRRVAGVGGEANPHAAGDLTHAEEMTLARAASGPFWLTDYPEGVRDSLYRRAADGMFETYDLILPGEHGELATGGLRPDSGQDVLAQARKLTREPDGYYASWKARTDVQTGGIGIGLERLVRFCSGAGSVLDLRFAHDQGPNALIGR